MLPIHDVANELSKIIDNDPFVSGNKVEKELQKALLTLPDKQRLVFNMKYFDDMPYKEIAAVLNVSVGGLKASYHIAVKKVSRFIESESI
jgi:RNA polymerase sigma-70 factor (ECF subfamily)